MHYQGHRVQSPGYKMDSQDIMVWFEERARYFQPLFQITLWPPPRPTKPSMLWTLEALSTGLKQSGGVGKADHLLHAVSSLKWVELYLNPNKPSGTKWDNIRFTCNSVHMQNFLTLGEKCTEVLKIQFSTATTKRSCNIQSIFHL